MTFEALERTGLAFWLVLLGLVTGCATDRPKAKEPMERLLVLKALGTGQLRLKCGAACLASWRASRSELRGPYENKLWNDLAIEVARVAYRSDLGFFYLGRAAEEAGSPRAAETYFKLSRASTTRCDGWLFNACDGVLLPDEATAALSRVGNR